MLSLVRLGCPFASQVNRVGGYSLRLRRCLHQPNARLLKSSTSSIETLAVLTNGREHQVKLFDTSSEASRLELSRFFYEMARNSRTLSDAVAGTVGHPLDPSISNVCNLVAQNTHKFNFEMTSSILHSLLLMGADPESKVVRYLENEIMWKANKELFTSLADCLSYHVRYQSTGLQKEVVKQLVLNLNKQLQFLDSPHKVIKLLQLYPHGVFSPDILPKIEEIALRFLSPPPSAESDCNQFTANSFSLSQTCHLIVLLSQLKRRPVPLLKAAAIHLEKVSQPSVDGNVEVVDPNFVISAFSALHSLNIFDPNLLNRFAQYLTCNDFMSKISGNTLNSLLITMGKLSCRSPQLLETIISESIIEDNVSMGPREMISLIQTLANVRYLPENLSDLLTYYVFPKVNEATVDNDTLWLDFVWSLAILGKLTPYHVTSTLSEQYVRRVLSAIDPHKHPFLVKKLLRIKSVAEIQMGLRVEPVHDLSQFNLPPKTTILQNLDISVVEALSNFITPKFFVSGVKSPLGTIITAEFIVNESMAPLLLSEYGVKGGDLEAKVKPLPEGFIRVALVTVGFKDRLFNETGLTGDNELAVNLLRRLGYAVVVIYQNEFLINSTTVRKVMHLQTMIKAALEHSLKLEISS